MILKIALSLIVVGAVTSNEIDESFIPEPNFTTNDKSGHNFGDSNREFDIYRKLNWSGIKNTRKIQYNPMSIFRYEPPKWLCDSYWCFPRFDKEYRSVFQKPEISENKISKGYFPAKGQSFQDDLNGFIQRDKSSSINFNLAPKESEPFIIRPGQSNKPAIEINNTEESVETESERNLRHFSNITPILPLKPQLSSANPKNSEKTEEVYNYDVYCPVYVHSVKPFENNDKFLEHAFSSEGHFFTIPVRKCDKNYITLELNGQRGVTDKAQTVMDFFLRPNFLRNINTDRIFFARPERLPIWPILTGQRQFPDINSANFGQYNSDEEDINEPTPAMENQNKNNKERVRSHSVKYLVNKKVEIRLPFNNPI